MATNNIHNKIINTIFKGNLGSESEIFRQLLEILYLEREIATYNEEISRQVIAGKLLEEEAEYKELNQAQENYINDIINKFNNINSLVCSELNTTPLRDMEDKE